MNPLNAIGRLFVGLGKLIAKAFKRAQENGLTEKVVETAEFYARQAAQQFVDKAERREWVVRQLMVHLGLPESIARLACEVAVQLLKAHA